MQAFYEELEMRRENDEYWVYESTGLAPENIDPVDLDDEIQYLNRYSFESFDISDHVNYDIESEESDEYTERLIPYQLIGDTNPFSIV